MGICPFCKSSGKGIAGIIFLANGQTKVGTGMPVSITIYNILKINHHMLSSIFLQDGCLPWIFCSMSFFFFLQQNTLSAIATKVSHIMIIFFFAIEKLVERGGKARRRVKRPPSHLSKSAQYKKKLFVMLLLLSFTALTRNVSFNTTSYFLSFWVQNVHAIL